MAIGILTGFSFFPIRIQYGPYGYALVLIFFLAQCVSEAFCKRRAYSEDIALSAYSIMSILLFTVYTVACCFLHNQLRAFFTANDTNFQFQTYGLVACIFLLCYTGKRGYSSPVFQWGCYLFFPLHLILLYGIQILLGILN